MIKENTGLTNVSLDVEKGRVCIYRWQKVVQERRHL